MRLFVLLSATIVIILTGTTTSFSCSCIARSLAEHVHDTDVIFSGTVIHIAGTVPTKDSLGRMVFDTGRPIGYTVVVKDIYKGMVADTVVVWSAWCSAACGYEFSNNETYLIYANARSEDLALRTSLCTATKPLDRAAEDLAWFAQHPQR